MSHYVKPHRGALVLVFGILSWVFCFIFGILAWMWGNQDLREMDAGRMDAEGRGLTQAGRILGMVHIIFFVAVMGILILFLVGTALVGAASQG